MAQSPIVNSIQLSEHEISQFSAGGAMPLRQLFPADTMTLLKKLVADKLNALIKPTGDSTEATSPSGGYGSYGNFTQMKYDLALRDECLIEILKSASFVDLMKSLIGEKILFSQDIAFELNSEKSGFPWHFGFVSFSYITPESRG